MQVPHVDLIPKKRQDFETPRFDVFAGEQLVGVIGQPMPFAKAEVWNWSLNTIELDGSIGAPMKGYAHTLDEAKADFRKASTCGSLGRSRCRAGI